MRLFGKEMAECKCCRCGKHGPSRSESVTCTAYPQQYRFHSIGSSFQNNVQGHTPSNCISLACATWVLRIPVIIYVWRDVLIARNTALLLNH